MGENRVLGLWRDSMGGVNALGRLLAALTAGTNRVLDVGVGMPKFVSIAAISALCGPLAWLYVMRWEWSEVSERYLDYLVIPMLLIWLGGGVLVLSITVAWQRIGPWALATGALSAVASIALVFIAAVFSAPCNSIMWSCSVPTLGQSATLGGMVAATSLLVWVHFAVATLVQRDPPRTARRRRGAQ